MQKSKSSEKCYILAKYWKIKGFSFEKLPICIWGINGNWMLEFQGENILRNNFHAALEAKIQTEIEEIKDQSQKSMKNSV